MLETLADLLWCLSTFQEPSAPLPGALLIAAANVGCSCSPGPGAQQGCARRRALLCTNVHPGLCHPRLRSPWDQLWLCSGTLTAKISRPPASGPV